MPSQLVDVHAWCNSLQLGEAEFSQTQDGQPFCGDDVRHDLKLDITQIGKMSTTGFKLGRCPTSDY